MVLHIARPQKHRRTSVYYFRQRVPADLVAAVGWKEIPFSLHTKDPNVAKERYAEEARKLALRWKAMRARQSSIPVQPRKLRARLRRG